MPRKLFLHLVMVVLCLGLISPAIALEKLQVGTSLKFAASYYLPMETAEEKGFWKANGLEVEWVPFRGTAAQFVAVAAGASNIGLATWGAPIVAADRGVPTIIVAEALGMSSWRMWVRTNSPYKHPRDLKGAKIGVSRLGGPAHTFARIVAKGHGLEKDIRITGGGGLRQVMAGIKSGALDGTVNPISATAKLKLAGVIREIASLDNYLPQPWPWGNVVFARKDFAQSKPELTRRVVKAVLQASKYLSDNPSWGIAKVKKNSRISEVGAKIVFHSYSFGPSGKIDARAVANIRKTFMEYGIMSKKVPPVDALYTQEYLP